MSAGAACSQFWGSCCKHDQ